MKAVILNLISVARRFRLALTLNILGLSVAFAVFMVIMIQLDYDNSFDKCHVDYDKIFRVEMSLPSLLPTNVAILSRPFAEAFIESSPYIVAGAITNHTAGGGHETYFHVEDDDGNRHYFREKSVTVSPEFFDVFTFDFVEGSADVYISPDHVFIPLSLARKIFGAEPAVGKQITHADWGAQTVLAVYRDFPANTFMQNCLYFAMQPEDDKTNWGNWAYPTFIRVNDAKNAPLLVENFLKNFDFGNSFAQAAMNPAEIGFEMYLRPLSEMHFSPEMQFDFVPKASRQTLVILLSIALVIIAIAAINFTNFSTALTPMRIKSINTQRVLGLRRNKIRLALVFEAILICLASYLVALLLVDLFKNTPLSRLVDGDLSFAANSLIIGATALVALLVGFLAGVYPSGYMTSFAPALVLKGSFALSPKGRQLRNSLTGIQFIASFALIMGASFMLLQNRFMQKSDLGFQKDGMITVDVSNIEGSRDAFTNQIKSYAGIDDVTYGHFLMAGSDAYSKWTMTYRGEQITFQVLPVQHTFLDVMGIEVSEGRNFRQEDGNTEQGVWIFNETARKQFDLELNTMTAGWINAEIIGFAPDVKVSSFRMAAEPTAFYVQGVNENRRLSMAYIKLNDGAKVRDALTHINATLAQYESNYPFEVRFYDEVLHRLYEKERALSSMISLFSFLAIFISIVGVFGLVVFDSECRRKEIGIRKVLGASVMSIILMFNKAYFKIMIICFAIAAPLAWYAVTRWLENFAYKTPMYWWVYLLALVAVGVITVATVTFQNWRVANEDPVKSIKN